MIQEEMKYITDIGIALSAEKDFGVLLELILNKVMELTRCDGGTLYLLNENHLDFHVMCTRSIGFYQGNKGNPCTLPPVPLTRGSVSALSVLEEKTIIIDDVYSCQEYDLTGPIRYDKMTGYHTQSILVVPIKERFGEIIGVLQLINAQNEDGEVVPFLEKYIRIVESVASQAAVTIENMRYLESIRELFQSFVRVLSTAIDERTPYNENHTRNMVKYGEKFIDYLNHVSEEKTELPEFTPEHKREIIMSIWFHDIGKLVTPLEIMNKMTRLSKEDEVSIAHRFETMRLKLRIRELEGKMTKEELTDLMNQIQEAEELIARVNKAGFLPEETIEKLHELRAKTFTESSGDSFSWITEDELEKLSIRKGTLTAAERKIMEQHVVVTGKLLDQISFTPDLKHVRQWAAGHHEFLNGSGYPEHISGNDIPKEVRIITIIDIFDALVAADRPYKKGMPVEKALMILKDMAEREGKLDREFIELFEESRCWEE